MPASAEVIDLSAVRNRRKARAQTVTAAMPTPMVAWVPVWFFPAMWFSPLPALPSPVTRHDE